MTRKQQEKQRRNSEIYAVSEELTIEQLSSKFKLSIPTIYGIIEKEKLKNKLSQ